MVVGTQEISLSSLPLSPPSQGPCLHPARSLTDESPGLPPGPRWSGILVFSLRLPGERGQRLMCSSKALGNKEAVHQQVHGLGRRYAFRGEIRVLFFPRAACHFLNTCLASDSSVGVLINYKSCALVLMPWDRHKVRNCPVTLEL